MSQSLSFESISCTVIDPMKNSQNTSQLLFEDLFGTPKYFNQRPWDVAMNSRLRKEYEKFEQLVRQEIDNGQLSDFDDLICLTKITLDRPMIIN